MNFSLNIAASIALLFALLGTITAQQTTSVEQAPFNAAAYRIGERLTYNVDYSQFVSAAHVEIFVAARGVFFGHDGIQLRAHVETNGVVNVALLPLNNDYTTFIYPESGLPYRGQQVVRAAGRATEAAVDYNQPAGTAAIPPKLIGSVPGTYDLLSAVYRVRATPLVLGTSYAGNVRIEGDEYQAEIKVTGKQLVKTSVGSFDAIVTKIIIKNAPDYNIRAYFGDDEWHVPVLVTSRHKGADIRIELAASEMVPAAVNTPPPRANIQPITNAVATPTPIARPSPSVQSSSNTPPDLPFRVGEQLNYRVYAGNGNLPIGSLSFALKNRGRYFNRDGLQFTWIAQASGAGLASVRDQITSYVDPTTLLPFRTELNFAEGSYRNVRNYNIDQDRGAAVNDATQQRIEIPVGTYDLVSAFYALRTFDLTSARNAISIMATSHPTTLSVKYERRETIDLNGQKIAAIVVRLSTDDPQGDKYQLRIWVGDDARHLPLRISAVIPNGTLRADLIIAPTAAP